MSTNVNGSTASVSIATRRNPIAGLTAVLIAAVAGGAAAQPSLVPLSEAPEIGTIPERVLAILKDGRGGFVAWTPPQVAGDQVGLLVQGRMPEIPMVGGDFIEEHTPLEVYLALAEPEQPIPEALLAHASDAEWHQLKDRGTRLALREELEAHLAELRPIFEAAALDPKAGGCSSGDRSAIRSAFGYGFGEPCGDPRDDYFVTVTDTDNYCNGGSGYNCDYPLGRLDGWSCNPAVASCDAIYGDLKVRTARALAIRGNFNFYRSGHHVRWGVYNCSGNGPLRIHHSRGSSSETYELGVNYWRTRSVGVSDLHSRAAAVDYVTYGLWQQGVPPSGSSYRSNKLEIRNNSGTDDRAIVCSDVKMRLDMRPQNGFCHNPRVYWCDDNSCTGGGCWD